MTSGAPGATVAHADPVASGSNATSEPTHGAGTLAELQLPRPESGEEVVAFTPGTALGDVALRSVRWAPNQSGATITGTFDRPFLSGLVEIAVDADGRATGTVSTHATVGIGALGFADVADSTAGWDPATPVPLPAAKFDGARISVAPPGPSTSRSFDLTANSATVAADDAITVELTDGALPADITALADLVTDAGTPLDGPTFEAISSLTDVSAAEIRLHHEVGGLEAPAVVGTDVLLPPGSAPPESPAGLAVVARAVAAIADGMVGLLPERLPDPAADDTVLEPAPAAPDLPAPAEPEGVEPGEPVEPVLPAPAAEPGGTPGETPEIDALAEGQEGAEPPAFELHMPPAPAAPTPEHAQTIRRSGSRASAAAGRANDLPAASTSTDRARGAVEIPDSETLGRAEDSLAAALGERPAPSPEIIELCNGIRAAVREKRPVDEDELLDADLEEPARDVGASLNSNIETEGDNARAGYDDLNTPPATTEPPPPTPVTPPDSTIGQPDLAAADAAPPPIPSEDLDLTTDRDELDRRVDEANIHRPTTEIIPEDPFSAVREGQAEMGTLSETGPAEVAAAEQLAISQAQDQMRALQLQAVDALNEARSGTVRDSSNQTGSMVESEAQTRDRISREAREIFAAAQAQVNQMLAPLTTNAMAIWNARVTALTTEFRRSLDEVKGWVDERHSGVGGAILGVWDSVTGLPGWVTRAYDRAEQEFTDGVCDALVDISRDVNSVIAAAEMVIESARDRIRTLFTDLPEGLEDWAGEQLTMFEGQLDSLAADVHAAQTSFVDEVSREAVTAVQGVQAEVEALREAARGLIGAVLDAIGEFLDDPVTAIINGLLRLVGIPPASFWALVDKIRQVAEDIANDPVNFINNLVDAVRQGFEQFFDRFGEHVIAGFWDWLFSGLQSVGVTLPADSSVKSLVTFALQIMGITWPNVREILVRHIGEENVELIEQAWELVSTLIEQGPEGLFEMIKEKLDPNTILQEILNAAIEYLIETLITQVVVRVVGLLNPAGAIYQAIELIYKVLRWIFENAARIFRLVETVVNGIADIIAGNISAMANAVEGALAQLVPVVIDFLAGLLGLGGLPDQIAAVIGRLQSLVLEGLDLVIGFLVARARALLQALGLGGDGDDDDDVDADADNDDQELGTSVSFSAAGESHRLWIDVAGGDATLMVASAPASLSDRLDAWQATADGRFAPEDPELAEATGLVQSIRTLAVETDASADAIADAYSRADALAEDEELPSDDPIEAKQRSIARLLDRLLTLLGLEDDPAAKLAEIATRLPVFGERRAEQAHASWGERLQLVQVGPPTDRQSLWPNGRAVLAGTDGAAIALLRQGSVPQALLGYFDQTNRDRSVDTQAFYEYVLVTVSPDPLHSTNSDFLTALGEAAATAIVASLTQHLADAPLSSEERAEADTMYQATNYVLEGPGLGRFDGLSDRPPDHRYFKPVDLPDDPGPNFSYRTEAGQTFTIEVGDDKLTRKVDGSRLRRFPGRGVTQNSPFFSSGAGLNRAHIIANQFGGSGFRSGANLVTTSAHYNQRLMAGREDSIRSWLEQIPDEPQTIADVEFDMSVGLEYGEMTDASVLDTIRADPDLPGDSVEAVKTAIEQAIKTHGIADGLRRVMDMDYDVTTVWVDDVDQRQTRHEDLAEADIWLLLSGAST